MQPWAEVHPNSRRAKALVCYQGEAGSNTAIVPCETDASLAGRFPVSSSSSFFSFYKAGIKRVREKSLLAFALAERKFPLQICHLTPSDLGRKMKPFFIIIKGLILHCHSWVVS